MHSQPNPAHRADIPADTIVTAEASLDEVLLGLKKRPAMKTGRG